MSKILDLKKQVKVVLLGQDPYHNPKQAHGKRLYCVSVTNIAPLKGLCFSVNPGVQIPPR